MIKCIASDMDGTLLQPGMLTPSPEIFQLIQRMENQGILFVAASGRSHSNLERLFFPFSSQIVLLAENGCYVTFKDKVLYRKTIPLSLVEELCEDILAIKNGELFVSCPNHYAIFPKTTRFVETMLHTWKMTIAALDNPGELYGDIFKVSLCMLDGLDSEATKVLIQKWKDRFEIVVSGDQWLDFTLANKGDGLRAVMEYFHFAKDEIAAFGDNFNDVPMLSQAEHSYVMAHAKPEIQFYGKNLCTRVEESIRKLLENQ